MTPNNWSIQEYLEMLNDLPKDQAMPTSISDLIEVAYNTEVKIGHIFITLESGKEIENDELKEISKAGMELTRKMRRMLMALREYHKLNNNE